MEAVEGSKKHETKRKRNEEDNDVPSKKRKISQSLTTNKKTKVVVPTVKDIIEDRITQIALKYWSPSSQSDLLPFDPSIIDDLYTTEIFGDSYQISRVMMLELSLYLERYLWPNFSEEASDEYVLSIIVMVNEKFRENVSAWDSFISSPDLFNVFMQKVYSLYDRISVERKMHYILFLTNCFNSLSVDIVRNSVLKIVSMRLWCNISEGRRESMLKNRPRWKSTWGKIIRREKRNAKKNIDPYENEKEFIPSLISDYFNILQSISPDSVDESSVNYCLRFVEFAIDLLCSPPSRPFFKVLLEDKHVYVLSVRSNLYNIQKAGSKYRQMCDILKFYMDFEIDDYIGEALNDSDIEKLYHEKMLNAQKIAFKKFGDVLSDFSFVNIASIDSREGIEEHLTKVDHDTLHSFALHLNIVNEDDTFSRSELTDIIVNYLERRRFQIDMINMDALYPDENILWDKSIVPLDNFTGESCLALPKLNLQFLTFHDYFLRNYDLFRLEAAYEIKHDIEDVLKRMQPLQLSNGKTIFDGWARLGVPIDTMRVTYIGEPSVGYLLPHAVSAHVDITLPNRSDVKDEWDALRRHDVLFLITVRPEKHHTPDPKGFFPREYGIQYIRGCEVVEVLDEEGNKVNDPSPEYQPKRIGNRRTLKVQLDPAQYQQDGLIQHEDVSHSFHLIMKRRAKENNFKAILGTIKDLMNSNLKVPTWLKDVFLGYGNPDICQNVHVSRVVNYTDSFLDKDHLIECIPNIQIPENVAPPYTIEETEEGTLTARKSTSIHQKKNIKGNTVRFTPVQISAIRQSMNQGLTLVVGPPGTGKTDVAVQVISNWYHNFPQQKTLIVTHSNQALNQIFEKIMHLNIDERHLLRMGHGQQQLETEKDFSKYGRVNYMLSIRMELLQKIKLLAESIGMDESVAYTCESAMNFFTFHVKGKWQEFLETMKNGEKSPEFVMDNFPFMDYFEEDPFYGDTFEENMEIASTSFKELENLYDQISDCQVFELLKSSHDRGNYLLTKQAKIIAMTCTHAALKRKDFVELGFKFDNILMEEAAQILEIETFIPMLLQEDPEANLKRIVLIGDHNQLPPVVKNMAFQKYAHLDQSLFTRFVRLGVPTIDLDMQGRCRESLANLFNWRYPNLGNLPHTENEEFKIANPAFLHEYQVINVENYKGQGEFTPSPYFYQNLGEAEYLVYMYMFMRLVGYPAKSITILSTYNGQKNLIRDIVNKKCKNDPRFGYPSKITTVDRYQGQQNDCNVLLLLRY
eukprot:TRINITY_DN7564_c0_g1_i1.p1 TRINITY_DN7564_c0_g1~~TRINITY_DN7564_c0_g1_i1.p1  ORF type:complete len:1263 (-),score=293.44 TRINITY_DN7564_c0_g1_i1:334-4095(-)